jgi:hypothetical protein
VVAAELLVALAVVGQVEPDLEAAGDALRAAERVEERVEVGAVALADVAGVARRAEAPALVVLVVGHLRRRRSRRWRGTSRACRSCPHDLVGHLLDLVVDEDQLVRLAEDRERVGSSLPSALRASRSVLISSRVQSNFIVISAEAPGLSISKYAILLPYLDSTPTSLREKGGS